jgi:hypothetical protein
MIAMKQLPIFFLLLITLPSFSQTEFAQQDSIKGREKIKAARVAYITEQLNLTPQEAEKFWPLYNAYADKRHDLKKQYREAKRSNQTDQALIDLNLKLEQQKLDLEKDFYNQVNGVIPANKLIKLREAEANFKKIILKQLHERKQHEGGKRYEKN